jgi:uncharacterized protein
LKVEPENQQAPEEVYQAAIGRTLPLFLPDSGKSTSTTATVPFVCRYRTDVIHPLSTQQVHALHTMVTKHSSLQSLRERLLPHISKNDKPSIYRRIMTSTSKTELEDLYAPYKPPSKGSILERIQKEHPKLAQAVDDMWNEPTRANPAWAKLHGAPKEALIQLLGTKLAAEPHVSLLVLDEMRKYCRVQTSIVKEKPTKIASDAKKEKKTTSGDSNNKYSETYGDFSGHLNNLRDHQVLAIRRGVNEKALKMVFDIDSEKMEKHLIYTLRQKDSNITPEPLQQRPDLLKEAIHDAWTRLLRRRGTTRLWGDKCKEAQDRACQVFEDNLRRALLAPPYPVPSQPVLALDPGFAAGIKCAVLDADGNVKKLETVKFVGNKQRKQEGVEHLEKLLRLTNKIADETAPDSKAIIVALGNGHGSPECRELIKEASSNTGIPIDIQLVNEAGASVWSVTSEAQAEFPEQQPASIAAISIGRRLQNPLFELVKVPPKSLGLGMYQHDLSEKELDEKLDLTSVDAVATVGVMVNSCSAAILQKVPGMSSSLANKVIKARPLKRRSDLLQISGLGPKTFENCAGFVRVADGPEPLDDTLVHPESYDLARYLLKKFDWKLDQGNPSDLPPRDEWSKVWKKRLDRAADKFHVSSDRVLAVLDHLLTSMAKEDPRLKETNKDGYNSAVSMSASNDGKVAQCEPLASELHNMDQLEEAVAKVPIRGIIGTVRNVADFGAFIDIGCENDGLLHISKLGTSLQLSQLLIGQQVGVDILSASKGRISLGLHGCRLSPSQPRSFDGTRNGKSNAGASGGKKRPMSTMSGGARKKPMTRDVKREKR